LSYYPTKCHSCITNSHLILVGGNGNQSVFCLEEMSIGGKGKDTFLVEMGLARFNN